MINAAEKISVSAGRSKVSSPQTFTLGSAWREGHYRFERTAQASTWILSCIVRGRHRIVTADGEVTRQGFRLRLIRPGLAYRVDSMQGGSYWCLFSHHKPWEPLLSWPEVLPGIMYLDVEDRELRRQIVRLLEETQSLTHAKHPQKDRLLFNAIERFLLLADGINPQAGHRRTDARIQRAMTWIGRHLHHKLSLDELAKQVHLSPSRLAHLFQQQVGMSPRQFHERGRLEQACHLLQYSNLPVKEIASELGFANAYHFSRRFSQQIKVSPRVYRQQFHQ